MHTQLNLGIIGACGRGAGFKAACDAVAARLGRAAVEDGGEVREPRPELQPLERRAARPTTRAKEAALS